MQQQHLKTTEKSAENSPPVAGPPQRSVVTSTGNSAKNKQPPSKNLTPKSYVPPIPFPQRLKKNKQDVQFSKCLEIFKKLPITVPFSEALEQMSSYGKFLKDALSKKRRLEDTEMVELTEECSAAIQRQLPPKRKDLGRFSIPCTIGTISFQRALCDPDVLVKVDHFIFPADFIVLDMEEDVDTPSILGRPFLITGRMIIDVEKGSLILRDADQEVEFKVFDATKYSIDLEYCFHLKAVDQVVRPQFIADYPKYPLKASLVHEIEVGEEPHALEMVNTLETKAVPSNIASPTLTLNRYLEANFK
ncbi:hypothetical protein L3X38_001524 [Prunus dulcis]|uniref:Aspartic peptidase DDI1-type domain-containing protein n=1 Tax=Prunus dulcis TaxID=3755 RepID=A0AAD4ZJ33_PRUDU|nr:hypothetical protein L3X38_001524 [Prunus dulcis]